MKAARPSTAEVFAWAVTRDSPTIAEAAKHFGCTQARIEDALDAVENSERLPEGQYLGIAVAVKSAVGITVLKRDGRIIEAYYANP